MGITQHNFYVLVNSKEEGEKLIKILNSKLYTFYINIFKWSGWHNRVILNTLPIPNIKNDFSDLDLYNYFGLSDEEINIIENNV